MLSSLTKRTGCWNWGRLTSRYPIRLMGSSMTRSGGPRFRLASFHRRLTALVPLSHYPTLQPCHNFLSRHPTSRPTARSTSLRRPHPLRRFNPSCPCETSCASLACRYLQDQSFAHISVRIAGARNHAQRREGTPPSIAAAPASLGAVGASRTSAHANATETSLVKWFRGTIAAPFAAVASTSLASMGSPSTKSIATPRLVRPTNALTATKHLQTWARSQNTTERTMLKRLGDRS